MFLRTGMFFHTNKCVLGVIVTLLLSQVFDLSSLEVKQLEKSTQMYFTGSEKSEFSVFDLTHIGRFLNLGWVKK